MSYQKIAAYGSRMHARAHARSFEPTGLPSDTRHQVRRVPVRTRDGAVYSCGLKKQITDACCRRCTRF